MEDTAPPEAATLLPGVSGIELTQVLPCFEDSFVAMLREKSGRNILSPTL